MPLATVRPAPYRVLENGTMKKTASCFLALGAASGALAAGNTADAPGTPGGWFAAAHVSTLGPGLSVGRFLNQNVSIRVNLNGGFDYDDSFTTDSRNRIRYDAELSLASAGLLADYHFGNGLKLTGGVYYNDNKIEAVGNFDRIRSGGQTWSANHLARADARIDFQSFAPYLGVGYHSTKPKGWSVSAEIGVLYQGSPRVSYNLNCTSRLCDEARPALVAAIEEERQALEDEVSDFKFYPVLSIGVSYRF
jgi:hypothetical protein